MTSEETLHPSTGGENLSPPSQLSSKEPCSPETKLSSSWWSLKVAQEHGWRLASIIAGIAMVAPKSALARVFGNSNNDSSAVISSSREAGSSEVVMTCLTLLLSFWAYGEVSLAIRRSKLPPGLLGWPLVGHTISFLAGPSIYFQNMKKALGSGTFTINVWELAVLCGETSDLA